MNPGEKYCEDVIAGRIPVCELTKLAVERHLTDLDRSKRGDIPFWYSQDMANHAINFIQRMKHVKGILAKQKKNFILAPHQHFITSVMYGWLKVHEDTGVVCRRINKVYRENARKEGKTAWAAANGNYLTYGEGEEGSEVYSFANKIDQARIVHKVSKSMTNKFIRAKENFVLRPVIEVLKDNISYSVTESFFEPLPSNSDKLDGLNPWGAIGDEVHEFDDPDLINVIETGMGSRISPMLILITTAGFNIYGPCYKIRSDQIKVLRGITSDDSSWAFIYTLDEGDDWHNQDLWIKPNPNIGVAPYWDYMRRQYRKAVNEGGRTEVEFKTKNLNIWTTTGDTWIQDKKWMAASNKMFDLEILRGRRCYVGMDLAANKDLTALVALFPPSENDSKYRLLCHFFCPEETIPEKSKTDRVNYDVWEKDGFIQAVPGPVMDYDYVLQVISKWKSLYNIRKLEYDRKFAYQLVRKIESLGINAEAYGQNTRDMTAPIKQIEKLILKKDLDHGAHPILRWNVSNVMLFTDSNDGVKFDKRKVVDRIDGCVAMAMAMGGYLSDPKRGRSKYMDEDLFPNMSSAA